MTTDARGLSWCFTVNNYEDSDVQAFRDCDCRYLVVGFEVGDSGTPHLQGYVVLAKTARLSALKKICAKGHYELARGSAEQNRVYCTKSGRFEERGIIPVSQKRKGELEAERWKSAKIAAQEGRLDDVPEDIYMRYYRTCKEIAKDHMRKPSDLSDLDNHWICGPPGCGKSRGAREKFPGAYFKLGNKWWDGYQGEENVIIDDWELDFKVLGHHLKIWADRYSFLAETKGGAMHIRPKRIIVTSNYRIDECFDDPVLCAAVKRRFIVDDMFLFNK